jgi:hypothetical protein
MITSHMDVPDDAPTDTVSMQRFDRGYQGDLILLDYIP